MTKNVNEDKLYLIELKNWENNNLEEEKGPSFSVEKIQQMKKGISGYRINNIVKKSVDTVAVFMAMLLGKTQATRIQDCSPFEITKNTKVILLSIINWTDADVTYIASVNTKYKEKFKSYGQLFGIQAYIVLIKDQATKRFSWVQ